MPFDGVTAAGEPFGSPAARTEWTPAFVASAANELRRLDPALGAAIDRIGPCGLRPDRRHFALLVRIIISQQISVGAARSISERLRATLPGKRFTPANLSRRSVDQLRSAGLTRAKAVSVKNLAEAVAEKRIRLARFATASDDEIFASLTSLYGIGRWTVQMLFIFGYGRPDVFPENDLGVRKAIADLLGRADLPTPAECRAVAEAWRPNRSVATWYLWRHADRTNATRGLVTYPV